MEKELILYQREDGSSPYEDWRDSLRDRQAVAIINHRLDRVKLGNLGNYRSVGQGVCELKINYGPGYRVYFAFHGEKIVVLLCGSDKSSQSRDIEQAHEHWSDFRRRL